MTEDQLTIARAVIIFGNDPGYEDVLFRLNKMKTSSKILERLVNARFQLVVMNNLTGDLQGEYLKLGGSLSEYTEFFAESDVMVIPSAVDTAITRETNRIIAHEIRNTLLDFELGRISIHDVMSGIGDFQTIESQSMSLMQVMDEYNSRDQRLYVPTGYSGLDMKTKGLCRKRMTILAARPGVGKSDLSLAIARKALKRGKNVFLASLEMDKFEIYERIKNAEGSDEKIRDMRGFLEIDDRGDLTVSQIAAAVNLGDYDLVIVDHLTLLGCSAKTGSLYERATVLSGQLRVAAKYSNAAWLVLSQLSRGVPDEHTRPKLSNLRDSGAIEQDSFMVMFLHELNQRDLSSTCVKREVELTIAKNRGGAPGKRLFEFRMGASQWEDISPHHH
jgi:replicative DNA helicase